MAFDIEIFKKSEEPDARLEENKGKIVYIQMDDKYYIAVSDGFVWNVNNKEIEYDPCKHNKVEEVEEKEN